jgi:perosamine synthetase
MSTIREFCGTPKLSLIEDCAHAFFGSVDGKPMGASGDYAIASAWKFFPMIDGGLLISSSRDLTGIKLVDPSPRFQAKALINTFEKRFNITAYHLPKRFSNFHCN